MSHRHVDFHCHLDLYPDHSAAIAEAEAAGVYTLAVTTTPRAWPRNRDLTRGLKFVRPALGLHPQLIARHSAELLLWEQFLPETRYVGEVGLDAGANFYGSFEEQKRVFRTVLECCAESGDKILSVHSLRSAPVVLDMLEMHFPSGRGNVVLHWFTGNSSDARRAVRLGCYFSINAEMLRSENGRQLVAQLPAQRILTESDGPFTKIGSRPTRPADVSLVLEHLAQARGEAVDVVGCQVYSNVKTLLTPL